MHSVETAVVPQKPDMEVIRTLDFLIVEANILKLSEKPAIILLGYDLERSVVGLKRLYLDDLGLFNAAQYAGTPGVVEVKENG